MDDLGIPIVVVLREEVRATVVVDFSGNSLECFVVPSKHILKVCCIIIGSFIVYVGRRGLDVAGLPFKKHSFDTASLREVESPMMRVPFSPISSTASSKANMKNLSDDMNMIHGETLQKTLPTNNMQFTTPTKTTSVLDDENRTPKAMPIPVPTTPLTVSVPMQTAMTPAPVSFATKVGEEIPEEQIEYSFEEIRAGFMLPKTHIKSMIQV